MRQRGQMVAISCWFDTIVNMGGSFVGYMYGEGVTGFSENTIWWINIGNGPLTTFLVLLSFNGTAFTDCSWHGIWKPERPKSKKVLSRACSVTIVVHMPCISKCAGCWLTWSIAHR